MVKKTLARPQQKTEVVIRVEHSPAVPTVSELSEPMTEGGKKLTLPKTWLSDKQILQMVQRTPPEHIFKRPGKGGKDFDYVTGVYVTKALNFIFGWNWDFEVLSHGIQGEQIWVHGKLTVHGGKPGETIIKTQFGRADIKFIKGSKTMVDFGNDLKAATTDALKKCASLLGIASDVYGKAEYKAETGKDPAPPLLSVSGTKVPHDVVVKPGETIKIPLKKDQVIGPDGQPTYVCSDTDEPISEQEYTFSMQMYGRPLSREAQKNHKPKKK